MRLRDDLFLRRTASLLGLIVFVALPAAAQNAAADYGRLVARHEASFEHASGSDSIHVTHEGALRDLEGKLRAIVGPFPVPGFIQPGNMNNDDMFRSDEDFDKMDGIRYQWPDSDVVRETETMAVVTVMPILRSWLERRSGIGIAVPLDVAFARDNVLTWVFPMDAAAVPYAQLPRDTLRALGLSWGWIGNFEQDDCPCAARHAVFMVERGQQIVLVALHLQHPIPPPETCLAERKGEFDLKHWENGDVVYRACYNREVVRDPRFGEIVGEIRELAGRIRRR